MTFTERTPLEAGFASVFDTRLAPELDQLDARRRELLRRARLHAGLALGAGLLLGLLILVSGDGTSGWGELFAGLGVPLAFGAVAAFLLWKRQENRWEGAVADVVMPAVCEFVGELTYDREARKGFPLERIRRLGVIPSFNSSTLSDSVEGRYRDTPFSIVEANLKSRSSGGDGEDGSSSTRTVFKGLLFEIGVPQSVGARILIARDHTAVGNKLAEMLSFGSGRGMPRVELEHDRFEQRFEVYADDPDTARGVLAPGFLDSLLEIAEAEAGSKGFEAGFDEDLFFLALHREEDFLRMGALRTPVADIEDDLHGVFADIASVRRIIDRLHGDGDRQQTATGAHASSAPNPP